MFLNTLPIGCELFWEAVTQCVFGSNVSIAAFLSIHVLILKVNHSTKIRGREREGGGG